MKEKKKASLINLCELCVEFNQINMKWNKYPQAEKGSFPLFSITENKPTIVFKKVNAVRIMRAYGYFIQFDSNLVSV